MHVIASEARFLNGPATHVPAVLLSVKRCPSIVQGPLRSTGLPQADVTGLADNLLG